MWSDPEMKTIADFNNLMYQRYAEGKLSKVDYEAVRRLVDQMINAVIAEYEES